jgi:putative NADH-flavin reductase
MSLFKTIAIVGGAGDLGKYITAAILAEGQRFELTLISRKSSGNLLPSTVPARVIEVENYSDSEDLTLALTGQDVLLSFHNTAAAPGGNISVYVFVSDPMYL